VAAGWRQREREDTLPSPPSGPRSGLDAMASPSPRAVSAPACCGRRGALSSPPALGPADSDPTRRRLSARGGSRRAGPRGSNPVGGVCPPQRRRPARQDFTPGRRFVLWALATRCRVGGKMAAPLCLGRLKLRQAPRLEPRPPRVPAVGRRRRRAGPRAGPRPGFGGIPPPAPADPAFARAQGGGCGGPSRRGPGCRRGRGDEGPPRRPGAPAPPPSVSLRPGEVFGAPSLGERESACPPWERESPHALPWREPACPPLERARMPSLGKSPHALLSRERASIPRNRGGLETPQDRQFGRPMKGRAML
jgi:hypothetical protein